VRVRRGRVREGGRKLEANLIWMEKGVILNNFIDIIYFLG